MVVGVMQVRMMLPGNHSLKGKRSVMNRLRDRIHNKFNVAIAEVDDQDKWQSLVIGISTVSNEAVHAEQSLQAVRQAIEGEALGHLVDAWVEVVRF